MSLAPGTFLGTYEVIRPIGAGGMGEVYRARDARLQRDVAIKLLPPRVAADPSRRRQFEEEARAAGALSHPNLLTVYDVGTTGDTAYIVCELLEGETLRARLARGAMPVRLAISCAQDIATGLAAAHARGIVHRDLKPENVFLTRDGRTKILDFGIATRVPSQPASATATIPGLGGDVVGTAGYMAPEQIRGGVVDSRADLFALGAVLHEMLCGRRAFAGSSAIETLNATLTAEAEPLEASSIGPGLARVVSRCLEKDVERRFQSASDVAFALEVLSRPLSPAHGPQEGQPARAPTRMTRVRWVALAVLIAGAASAGYFLALSRTTGEAPGDEATYRTLTFRRGYVSAARFVGADTLVYSAAWDGQPLEIYTASVDRPESRPLGVASAGLLAASPQGMIAISLGCQWNSGMAGCPGTLAEVPITGGSPRELLRDVVAADYSPRGELAVVRRASRGMTIEQPIGTVHYESSSRILQLRVSPDGDTFAFLEEGGPTDGVALSIVSRGGAKRTLADGFSGTAAALAWSGNDALWVGASRHGQSGMFEAGVGDGRLRTIERHMSPMALQDRLPDGRALLVQTQVRQQLMLKPNETEVERDLSWFDFSVLAGLSRDARWVLFNEAGAAVSGRRTAYFRRTDGSPAIKLFDGAATALSHDGKIALVLAHDPSRLILVPTGPGEPVTLPRLETGDYDGSYMAFFPDDRRILFFATERQHGLRAYVQDLPAGQPRPVSEEVAQSAYVISPDGHWILVPHRSAGGVHVQCPVDGSLKCARVRGLDTPRDVPIAWSADGALYVRDFVPGALRSEIRRLDLARGISTPFRTVQVTDPTGAVGVARVMLAPEAGAYGYVVQRVSGAVVLASQLH